MPFILIIISENNCLTAIPKVIDFSIIAEYNVNDLDLTSDIVGIKIGDDLNHAHYVPVQ